MSSVMLVLAIYVRPGSYAIGGTIAVFIIYANAQTNIKKAIVHAIIFLVTVYALLGIWQIRKIHDFGRLDICWGMSDQLRKRTVAQLCKECQPAYARNDTVAILSYWHLEVFLFSDGRPGSLKYFHVPGLTALGKVLGYLWVAFSGIGFIYGIRKIGQNIYYHFLLFIVINYVCGSIIGEMWNVGERYRIQMEPFLAILSAYGWILLIFFDRGKIRHEGDRCKNITGL